MASYSVSVPHDLGISVARARVEQFLDDVRRDYAAHISDIGGAWTEDRLDFRFHTSGMPISGALVVKDAQVDVSGPLPLMASLFRGRIEQTIRDELRKLLS
jgi:hypothetical protein